MNLVFLHGRPATGKYTVGRELSAVSGYHLYHNHLVVDAVLRDHAFGSPEFVALRARMWREFLGSVRPDRFSGVIFTFSAENAAPQSFIDWIFQEPPRPSLRILPAELCASEAATKARLASSQRQGFRKLTDVELYRRLRAAGTFDSPVIPPTGLRIDTETMAPHAAAQSIAAHYELQLP